MRGAGLGERTAVLLRFDREETEALRYAALAKRKSVRGFVREVVEQAVRELRAAQPASVEESDHEERQTA